MRRGDLYLQGERTVLVVSHDAFNRVPGWRSVIVVPLTMSDQQARRGPTAVPIPDGAGGLRGEGVAVCHQLTTIDRVKLTRRLGSLPQDTLAAVEAGIKAALDLA